MTPDPKAVLALAEEIVKAEKHLDTLKRSWESYFSGKPVRVQRDYSVRQTRDDNFTARLESTLNEQPHETFSIPDLADKLHVDALKLSRTLFRLSKSNRIESRGRGLYGAKRQLTIAEGKAA